MKELALSMTRAAVAAQREGREDDARRIGRALATLLSLDDDDDDDDAPGTRLGLGQAA